MDGQTSLRNVQMGELKSLPKDRAVYKVSGKVFFPVSRDQLLKEVKAGKQ